MANMSFAGLETPTESAMEPNCGFVSRNSSWPQWRPAVGITNADGTYFLMSF